MSQASNYLENKLTDHIFRNTTFTAPTGLYISLHTADPTDAANGAEVSTSATAYARTLVTPNTTNWAGTQSAGSTTASTGVGGVSSNNGTITFPAPTGSWGVVTHFGVWDASTSGNLLVFGALGASKTINGGDAAPSFAAAALTVTIA